LTAAEVEDRRRRGLGHTEDAGTSRPVTEIVRSNVFTRINAILAVLLAVIIVVGPFQDALFAFVLVFNTAIGIGQELRAKWTLDRLAVLNAPRVRVWRDGAAQEVAAGELVVDAVVDLHRGDQVPLDGEVLDGDLELDESLLTGESDPVPRPAGSPLHSGSFVSSGSGAYRVTAVGSDSYAQAIAGEARRFGLVRSELEDGVNRILRLVQWAIFPVGGLLAVRQLLSDGDVADAVRGSVAGVGAMVPEGLVLLTSVAFAVAVVRLGRRRVLVQELPAVEGLARVDVVCLDKTGTLTHGGIEAEGIDEIAAPHPGGDRPPGLAVEALGALAAAERHPNATLAAIRDRWPAPAGWETRAVVSFSSARRWSAADFGPRGVWVLGAPDRLLPMVGLTATAGPTGTPGPTATASPTDQAAAMVGVAIAAGRRVVLLARAPGAALAGGDGHDAQELPDVLEPVAVVRLAEQVRDDAPATIAYLTAEGIAVKVISGDHPATVAAIAAAGGVPGADQAVDAAAMSDEDLRAATLDHTVFGRVAPRQKQLMVAALHGAGRTVAMTGDGVNDVLALKDADVGIAMGSGSPATRAVAQLVLLDDSFAALPPVIAEGRRVMANVERVANLFVTKTAYATLIAVTIGVVGAAYPFLPRHLTIVSDFSIGIPAFFLALLPTDRRFQPGFVDRVLRFAVPNGVVVGIAALAAYFLCGDAGIPLTDRRTAATMVLVILGLWVLSVLARPFTPFKAGLVAAMAACSLAIVETPGVRTYFDLRLPPAAPLAETLAVTAVAGAVLEVLYRRLRVSTALAD
jgi:cation-transporting ATPase E